MGKLTLVLGGARSGKSHFAQNLAARRAQTVTYIATAQALDPEMETRIEAHKRERPAHWRTLEIPSGVGALNANELQAEVILLDCLTLLVSNLVLGASDSLDEPDEAQAGQALDEEIQGLLKLVQSGAADWIVVSNEVGLGLVPPYPVGRLYRDLLGKANRQLASAAGEVYFMVAGMPLPVHRLLDMEGLLDGQG